MLPSQGTKLSFQVGTFILLSNIVSQSWKLNRIFRHCVVWSRCTRGSVVPWEVGYCLQTLNVDTRLWFLAEIVRIPMSPIWYVILSALWPMHGSPSVCSGFFILLLIKAEIELPLTSVLRPMLKTRRTVWLVFLRLNSSWLLAQKSRWLISLIWISLIALWKTRPWSRS